MTNRNDRSFCKIEKCLLPIGWKYSSISDIAAIRKEKRFPEQGIKCIELEHIESNTGHISGWDATGAQASIKTVFIKNDILFGKLRPYLRKYAIAPFDGICTTEIFAIYPIKSDVDGKFLYWLMQSDDVFSEIDSLSFGTKMPRVTWNDISALQLKIPPLPEQNRIANVLMALNAKIQNISAQITATQALKQSLMQMLFKRGVGTKNGRNRQAPCSNPISFGKIAPIIRRPVDVVNSTTYPELGLRSFGKGTFHKPALTGEAVGGKRLFAIEPGDLLFSNVFAWEGAVAVVKPEDKGRFGSHRFISCNVDKSRANAWYLYRYFTTPDGIAKLQLASPGGAGRNKTLGLSALAAISIPLPSLAEQEKVVAIMEEVDAKLAFLTKKQALYQTLKRGLMQKLLSGEWRVKCDDATAAQ
jgi:type I restriction enzyme, S subunit